MNYIFYQTKTKFSNTGDALINSALIAELRKRGKLAANCSASIPHEFVDDLAVHEEEKLRVQKDSMFAFEIVKKIFEMNKKRDKIFIFSGPGDMRGGNNKTALRNLLAGGG